MTDDKTSLQEVVANYLRENPGFLLEYPDVLESLELSHQAGGAASLIERQVQQLRTSNEEQSRQLNRLVQIAADNERLLARLHRLTLELMTIRSRRDFFTHLGNSLLNDFNADILQICLFDTEKAVEAGEDVMGIAASDPLLEPFRAHLDKSRAVCGRLAESKLEFLFGSKARWVQSTALVPIGDGGSAGMMAIGSSDPARFYPGMGTIFLDLLADVIATRLEPEEPQVKRRSA
jgi:uncharacterized protein YigA (DUF484 family)